ncbi:variola B22R gene family protein [Fowlpox virus]|nr:variola B22R gene family protein [Fowlpox virus]URH26410.1 variola B22R gene family protein [Fowlpox virus]
MDIITILIIFVAITRSEFCRRKLPIYHDTRKDLNPKEKTDYAATATYGYLSIAERIHKETFIESFNWDSILASVKKMFLDKCSNDRGVIKYNYTVMMNITVSADTEDGVQGTSYKQYKDINKNIINTLLLHNNSVTDQFINETNDRTYFELPVMEHISYSDSGCNNVTIDKVIISKFSVIDGDKARLPQSKSIIPIIFKGVSTHEPYTDSDQFIECITKKVNEGCLSPKGKAKIDKSVINNCETCTVGLMVEVTDIPEEFYTTLKKNGATSDTLSELLYACMMTNGKDCIDYVAPTEKFQSDTLLSLSSYIKQYKHRVKRDIDTHGEISMEDIKCIYNMYDTRKKDDFTQCMITSKSRSKRETSEDGHGNIDMAQYLKKIMKIRDIIPKEATHLQLGTSTSYSKGSTTQVAGDIDIRAKVKDRAKKTLQSFLPNIPADTRTDEIYDKINRPRPINKVPEDSQNILSRRLAAITARKIESVRGVLESRIGYSSSTEDAGYAELQFMVSRYESEEEDIRIVENHIRRGRARYRTGDNLVENIAAYRKKGGKGIHVVSTVSDTPTGLFDVDTSTVVVSPLTRKGTTIIRNTMGKYKNVRELVGSPVTSVSELFSRNEPENSSTSRRRCKRGTNDVVCAMLGQRSRPEGNPNDVYVDAHTASSAMNSARSSSARGFSQDPYQRHIEAARAMGIATGRQGHAQVHQESFQDPYQRHIEAARAMGIIVPEKHSLQGRRRHPSTAQSQELIYMSSPNMGFLENTQQRAARPFVNLVTPYAYYDVVNSARLTSYNDYDRMRDSYNLARRPLPRIPGSSRSHSSSYYDSLYSNLDIDDIYSVIGDGGGSSSGGRRGSVVSVSSRLSANDDDVSYKSTAISKYSEKMKKLSSSTDKAMVFSLAIQTMSMNMINRQSRLQRIHEGFRDDAEAVIESVSTALSSIGTSMSTAGIVISPHLALAGMGLTLITGLIDIGKDIYYSLSGIKKPSDPLVLKFNMYREIVADTEHTGVRKCLMPGSDLTIFLSYRSDTSFMPQSEKLATHFIDTIDSVLYYLNTSGIIVDFGLTVACPIGHLRSTTLDITAYTTLKFTTDEGVKFYQFVGLAAMLSKFPIVELTCGKDITLTLKPFEVKMTDMQLLKMSTSGEPPDTKTFPSNVCDLFPMKNFYLLLKGCPYDASQTSITRTTCSILMKMTIWDDKTQRWILENPFEDSNKHRQLFTFDKYDFNDTIIKPNTIPGHAKYCTNRHIKECFWNDVMILDDITSCNSRVRILYVEVYTFNSNAGFNSFVLSCPSGSTPVAVGNTLGLIELPLSDFFSVKMFGSTEERSVAVFCVHNEDSRYKSDILMVSFVKPVYPEDAVLVDTYKGKKKLFDDLVKAVRMPWRSRTCVTWRQGRTCIGYYGKVAVWPPDYILNIDIGTELLITEKYDPSTVDAMNLKKAITRFPYELDIEFSVSELGRAYDDPNRFWDDAKKQLRTYSSILLLLLPCTSRANILIYDANVVISVLGYMQSQINDYGDGKKYTFRHMEGGECTATLDLTLKSISMKCPMFTIPRNISKYEGLCFVTITSKDHCAIKGDEYKKYGYPSNKANEVRHCGVYTWPNEEDPGHYCGYISNLNHVPYTHPEYEACKANILIHYRDTWIESEVLDKPPYVFDFKYDKKSTNEYVDKELSDKLKTLYDDNIKLIEYRDGSLAKSINRLSEALTKEARSITDVLVDTDLIEISYAADQEKILELEEKIKETTQEVLTSTLSDEDLEEIFYKNDYEKCCLLDLEKKLSIKVYPEENYSCGLLEDFVYEHNDQILLLVNDTFMDYELVNVIGMPVLTCIYPIIVPLVSATKKEVEDAIILHAIEEGIQELLYELDYNISIALLTSELSYTQ